MSFFLVDLTQALAMCDLCQVPEDKALLAGFRCGRCRAGKSSGGGKKCCCVNPNYQEVPRGRENGATFCPGFENPRCGETAMGYTTIILTHAY